MKIESIIGNTYGHLTVVDVIKARSGATHKECVCRCICGKITYSRKFMLENRRHISCGCKGIGSPSPGDKFGEWVVISEDKTSMTGRKYVCQCSCGTEKIINLSDLMHKKSTKCYSCAQRMWSLQASIRTKGPYERLYDTYMRNAKSAGREFSLTMDDAIRLFTSNCHYCLAEPYAPAPRSDGEYLYNGIDRKNNALGYTKENSLPCCSMCNMAKRGHNYEQYVDWLHSASQRLATHKLTEHV